MAVSGRNKNCFLIQRNSSLIHSGLWGLVNNAGITLIGPIEWIPLEKSKHVADVNLWGMIDVTKTFLLLVKKAQGRVVNLSSMLGKCKIIAFIFGTRTMNTEHF